MLSKGKMPVAMKIREVAEALGAKVVCGNEELDREVEFGFASDLMSDVLTLQTDSLLLITGLTNLQAIRTAEMSDISCVVFVRNKRVTPEMSALAQENEMVLLECPTTMFKAAGLLFGEGLKPLY